MLKVYDIFMNSSPIFNVNIYIS